MTVVDSCCGLASLAAPGEVESGDRCVVNRFPGGALIAVVDALGHGHEAALTASVAAAALGANGMPREIDAIAWFCHQSLRSTRGAALAMVLVDLAQMQLAWLGVGNVMGLLMQGTAQVRFLTARAGVVGDRMPQQRATRLPIHNGDCLVMATDGVREDFVQLLPTSLEPQALADRIVQRFAKGSDDALALVYRFEGGTDGHR